MKQQFDWHARKAETNRRDHGVTFEQRANAVADVFAVEWIDDREDYGEERINLLGMCDGILLHETIRSAVSAFGSFQPEGRSDMNKTTISAKNSV